MSEKNNDETSSMSEVPSDDTNHSETSQNTSSDGTVIEVPTVVTEHDILNSRREWRRLAGECKKNVKVADSEIDVTEAYYSAVDSYGALVKKIEDFLALPDVAPKSAELRKTELESLPKEKQDLDAVFNSYKTNQDLMTELAKTRNKNSSTHSKKTKSSRRSSQRSSVLRKRMELEQAEKDAEVERAKHNANLAVKKAKEEAERLVKQAKEEASAKIAELERQQKIEKKRLELRLAEEQAKRDHSEDSSYQSSAASSKRLDSIITSRKKKEVTPAVDLPS